MTALVACPKCKTRLKLQSLPLESKKIQCPKCQTYFMVSAPKPTSVAAKAPPGRTPSAVRPAARGSGKGKWIAVAAAVLLAMGGGSAAYIFTRGQSQPEKPGPYETPIVANKEKEKEKEDPPRKEPVHNKPRVRDNKHHEFTRHMVKAGQDSQARRYESAIGHYKDALNIFPDDKDALQGKADSEAALAAQSVTKSADDKNKTELTEIIKQGYSALGKRQYAAAVEFFKIAVQKAPEDSDAKGGLTTAAESLARSVEEQDKLAKQVAEDQKKLDDYNGYIASAQAMLTAKNFADAYQKAVLAQGVFPANPDAVEKATELRKLAETGLAGLQNQDDRRKQFTQLMAQGGAALQNNRAGEAEQVYKQALALYPDDATAAKGVADAQALGMQQQTQLKMQYQNAMTQGNQALAAYQNATTQGNQALAANQLAQAVASFQQAANFFPDDPVAQGALANAQQALNYNLAMNRAAIAMMVTNYPAAISAYSDALAVIPGDQAASQGLLSAQGALAQYLINRQIFDTKVAQAIPFLQQQQNAAAFGLLNAACQILPTHPNIVYVQQLTNYAGNMMQGPIAANAKKYPDAVTAYANAFNAVTPLAAMPVNDPLAQQLLPFAQNALTAAQQAQQNAYNNAMAQGQTAMNAKNYPNAITAFQNALAAVPGDPPATQALSNAQTANNLALAAGNQAQQAYAAKMQAANALLAQLNYLEAVKLLNEALKLAPDNKTATAVQTQATYAQAMSDGKKAAAANNFANAVTAFKTALANIPNDPVATQELQNAQQALSTAGLARKDFDSKVQQANDLLKQQKYAEASQMLTTAIGVLPKDPQVAGLQTQILYANSMVKGQTAMTAKNYSTAVAAYTDALKNTPGDPAATQALADVRQAMQGATQAAAFNAKVQQANTYLSQKKYADAAKAFKDAAKLMPSDPQVEKLQTQSQYADAMSRGQIAANAKNYAAAVKAYNDALGAQPSDAAATQALNDAQNALTAAAGNAKDYDAKVKQGHAFLKQNRFAEASQVFSDAVKLMPNNPQNTKVSSDGRYADAMSKGLAAMSVKNYREAVNQFQAALNEMPTSTIAQTQLNNARKQIK